MLNDNSKKDEVEKLLNDINEMIKAIYTYSEYHVAKFYSEEKLDEDQIKEIWQEILDKEWCEEIVTSIYLKEFKEENKDAEIVEDYYSY